MRLSVGTLAACWASSLILTGASTPTAGTTPPVEPSTPPSTEIEISFLANEGLLLRGSGVAVAIDAFVAEGYSIYGHLAPGDVRRLQAGEAPFTDLRLALVSHVHRDHLQPEVAASWLRAGSERRLAGAPEVLAAVTAADPDLAPSLREEWPAQGATSTLELGGVRVTSFRLSHGTGRQASIQNLGHVIRIDGVDVLHVGDAEMRVSNFEPFADVLAEVDVALLPYWYWEDDQGLALIARFFRAVPKVAVHVPPGELDAVRGRLAVSDPEVVVFRDTHESRRFGALLWSSSHLLVEKR